MRYLSILFFLSAFLAIQPAVHAQIRVEKDSRGKILITNKGSKKSGKSANKSSVVSIPAISSAERSRIESKLRSACKKQDLDYNLIAALVQIESDFRPNVLSKRGAVGLMQLMPKTARSFGCDNPWDLDQNISAGTAFVSHLMKTYDGNIPLVLAAYNAGEEAVNKYRKKIPPYGETVRYVFKILERMGRADLTAKAKKLLARPGDYDRLYLSSRNTQPTMRIYYMHIDSKGHRHIYDYPPSHVDTVKIIYKDE